MPNYFNMHLNKLNLDHLIGCPSSVTLTFKLPEQVSNGTSTLQGGQLCQFIFKNKAINVEITAQTNPDRCTQDTYTYVSTYTALKL